MGTPNWDPEHGHDDYMEGELDDLDRELLGEGSDGDSTDDQDDDDDDENSSTYEGANGYARHEASSPPPAGLADHREADGDEVMED
jgi:Ino eighty subunit 1